MNMKIYMKLSPYLQINEQATKINKKKVQAKKTFSVMSKPEMKSFKVKEIPKTIQFKTLRGVASFTKIRTCVFEKLVGFF